jgi:hypothetical protein
MQHSILMRRSIVAFSMAAMVFVFTPQFASAQKTGRPVVAVSGTKFNPDMVKTADGNVHQGLKKAYDFALVGNRLSAFTAAIGPKNSWATTSDTFLSRDDRVRNVLQRCQHYEKTPCALVAIDGMTSGNTKEQPSTISYPARFNFSAIPFVAGSQLAEIQRSYRTLGSNKALAINAYGYYGMAGDAKSTEEAIQQASEKCSAATKEKCFIYSINEDVLFNAKTPIYDDAL